MNNLREKLEALSAAATQGEWDVAYSGVRSVYAGHYVATGMFPPDKEFISEAINAYRSGDLVTREEMDAAVKAERKENCARVVEVMYPTRHVTLADKVVEAICNG